MLFVVFFVFTGNAGRLMKGDFQFEFTPEFNNFRFVPTPSEDINTRTLDARRIMTPEEMFQEEQRKMSDETAEQRNKNVIFTTDTEEAEKKKIQEEEAKKIQAQKDLDNTTLSVSPSQAMSPYLTVNSKTVSATNPLKAAQYTLCANGPSEVTITNVKFMNQDSGKTSVGHFFVQGKAPSIDVSLSNYWTGDFMTLDNYKLPANTCVDAGMNLVSVNAAAEWQRIILKGVKANAKVTYVGEYEYFYSNENNITETSIFGSHITYMPVQKYNVKHLDNEKSFQYLSDASQNQDRLYGTYGIATPFNGTTKITALKIKLETSDFDSVEAGFTLSPVKQIWEVGSNLQNYKYPNQKTVSMAIPPPATLVAASNSTVFKANETATIPVDITLNGANVVILEFTSSLGVPKTSGTFKLHIVGLESNGESLTDFTTLETPTIQIVDKVAPKAKGSITLMPNPGNQFKTWMDSDDVQAGITKNGHVKFLTLDTNLKNLNFPDMKIQKLELKIDGTFKSPLNIDVVLGDVLLPTTYTVNKGGVLTLTDIPLDYTMWNFQFFVKNIPGDPKFPLHIKPRLQNIELVYAKDGANFKKDEKIPVFLNQYDIVTDKWIDIPLTTFPATFGITSIGPSSLNYKDLDSGNVKGGATVVSIGNLPKGQVSEFTMNKACFISQGNASIYSVTYNHASREKSPFKDIKLSINESNNIYLKSADWTKEQSKFILTTPEFIGNDNTNCFSLVVLDPLEPVEDIWFHLIGIEAKTAGGKLVPVYANSIPLDKNPVKGSTYIFK